jgi:hypothetical protein
MTVGCWPIEGNWSPTPIGKCVDFFKLYKSMVVSDVLLDGLVLIIPMYPVWQLQMPTRQKISVSGIFLLGGLVVLSGIFRIKAMFQALVFLPDRDYNESPAFYWATIETGTGILSACLPTFKPLFDKSGPESVLRSVQRRILGSMSNKSSKLSSEEYTLDHRLSETSESVPFKNEASGNGESRVYHHHPPTPKLQQQQQRSKAEGGVSDISRSRLNGIRVDSTITHSSRGYDEV